MTATELAISTWEFAVATAAVGVAGVLVVAWAFYVVGRSEDRDRDAERDDSPRTGA
jgi:uncharacterized membrane protein